MSDLAGKTREENEAQKLQQRAQNRHQAREGGVAASVMDLQRSAGNRAVSRLLGADSGQPLDLQVRAQMESRFGRDFRAVRIHNGAHAADAAVNLSAKAFTVGSHIAFSFGRFAPDTQSGRRLLAHELAHVVQQSRGGIAPPSLDPVGPLEQSANAASKAALGDSPSGVAVTGASGVGIARSKDEDDEDRAKTNAVIQMQVQRARLLEAARKGVDRQGAQTPAPKATTDVAPPPPKATADLTPPPPPTATTDVTPPLPTATTNVAPPPPGPPTTQSVEEARRAARKEKGEATWAAMEQLGERFGMDAGVSSGDRIRLENKAANRTAKFRQDMEAAGYKWTEQTTPEAGWSGKWEPITGQANPKKANRARVNYDKSIASIAEERNVLRQKARGEFFGKETGPTTLNPENLDFGAGLQKPGHKVETPVQPDVHLPLAEPKRVTGPGQGQAEPGLLARHEHQPPRGTDLISEHVQPGAQYKAVTKTPSGPMYNENQYAYDKTVSVKKDVADIKTYEGPYSDNKRTEALKKKAEKGGRIDIIQDIFLPSLRQTYYALDTARKRRAAVSGPGASGAPTPADHAAAAPANHAAAAPADHAAAAPGDHAAAVPGDHATAVPADHATAVPADHAAPVPATELQGKAPTQTPNEKPATPEQAEGKPSGGGILHAATQVANEGAALVRAYDSYDAAKQAKMSTPLAALRAVKTYQDNTNIVAGTVANYQAKRKDGQDPIEAGLSTAGETLGGFLVPGKGIDQAINAGANVTDAVDDHLKRGDLNATAKDQKASLRTGADFAAELTPSRMFSQTLGAGLRAYWDIGKAIGGDSKGVDKMGDDATRGKLGMIFQPFGMAADFAGNLGSGEGSAKALDKTLKKGEDSTLGKAGNASGQGFYDLGQCDAAKAGDYTAPVQGWAMISSALTDHIAGKSWDQALEHAAKPGENTLLAKVGGAGGDLAWAAHQKAAEVIDKDIPALKAEAQEKVAEAKAVVTEIKTEVKDKLVEVKDQVKESIEAKERQARDLWNRVWD